MCINPHIPSSFTHSHPLSLSLLSLSPALSLSNAPTPLAIHPPFPPTATGKQHRRLQCLDSLDRLHHHLSQSRDAADTFLRRFVRFVPGVAAPPRSSSSSSSSSAAVVRAPTPGRRLRVYVMGLLSGVINRDDDSGEERVLEFRQEMTSSGARREHPSLVRTTTGTRATGEVLPAVLASAEFDLVMCLDLTGPYALDLFHDSHQWIGPGPYLAHRSGQTAQLIGETWRSVVGQVCQEMADVGAAGPSGRPAIPFFHAAQRSVLWHGEATPVVASPVAGVTELHFPLESESGGDTTVVGCTMTSRHIAWDSQIVSETMPSIIEAFRCWVAAPLSAAQETAEAATQAAAVAAAAAAMQ